MNIGVVIPAYNEADRIGTLLSSLKNNLSGYVVTVVVVDDGSADSTHAAAKKAASHLKRFRIVRHKTNLGKGAAAKTGCQAVSQMGVDVIVLMDGDGQHAVDDISRLVKPLEESELGLVIGSRKDRGAMPATMRFGNKALTALTKLLFGVSVQDTQSGFRAFTAKTYPLIQWIDPRYAMETEMLIFAAVRHVPVMEVGIPTVYHDSYKGTTVLDGLRILATILMWRFRLLRSSSSSKPSFI